MFYPDAQAAGGRVEAGMKATGQATMRYSQHDLVAGQLRDTPVAKSLGHCGLK